jgi:hypothetical protein
MAFPTTGSHHRSDHVALVDRPKEGQITKLKLIRRRMYSRGKLGVLQSA